MNSLATTSNYTPVVKEPQLNALIEKANAHGLYAQVKIITPDDAPMSIEPGCYIIIGSDQKKVAKLASPYSNAALFPAEYLQQDGSFDLFPRCTIIKSDYTFSSTIKIIESILDSELISNLFKRYGHKVPEVLSRPDFQTIYNTYQRSLEPRGESSKADLEYYLKIISSGMTFEEYEKKVEKNTARFKLFSKSDIAYAKKAAKQFSSKTVRYEPVSENCVSAEHILDLPYSKSKMNVSHGDNASVIRRVDEELGKHPEIKWSLKEVSKIEPYGKDRYQYWHTLTYPTKYESVVAGIVNKIEYELDNEEAGRKISKTYIKGAKENITSISIPVELFNAFAIQAARDGLEYYYDENSAYVAQKPDSIGICVEDNVNRMLLMQIVTCMAKSLANDSHMAQDPVYLAEKNAYKAITQKDRDDEAR